MEPIRTKKETSIGLIEIEIGQFKTVYTFMGCKYDSLRFFTPEIESVILRLERDTLRRHYAAAMAEKTPLQLMSTLADLGVTTKSIEFPCQGENCTETAIEEMSAPLRIDEVASEAEYSCEFTDGLCQSCYEQEQREEAEEEVARAREEAQHEA